MHCPFLSSYAELCGQQNLFQKSDQSNNQVIAQLWKAIADNVDEGNEYMDETDSMSGKDDHDEDRDNDGDVEVCVGYEDDAEEEDIVEGDDEEEDVGEEDDNCDVDRPTKFHRTDHGRIMSQSKGAKGPVCAEVLRHTCNERSCDHLYQ